MHSRWYNITVIVLWVAAMTWLVATKVAPSLWFGEPPNGERVLRAQQASPFAGWWVGWMDGSREQPLGWAVVETRSVPQDITRTSSVIQLDLPLRSLVPASLPKWLGGSLIPEQNLLIESHNEMDFDAFGRLSRFECGVRQLTPSEIRPTQSLAGHSVPVPVYVARRKIDDLVKLRGSVDGDSLWLVVSSPTTLGVDFQTSAPTATFVKDPLSPQVALPGLRLGQRWTTEVYDPMAYFARQGTDCRQILHACVEREAALSWDDQPVKTLLVVFRNDPTASLDDDNVQGKLWVAPDGTVLKQQAMMLGKTFTFVRMTDREAEALAEAWRRPGNPAWTDAPWTQGNRN